MVQTTAKNALPRVVIIGGGFGGLTTAQALKNAPVQVTVVDRTNHHLFQPLLYQVAMAGLSPADIAAPIRSVLRKQKNVSVLLAEATGIDLTQRTVQLRNFEGERETLAYDYLVLATGGRTSYFGHDDWEKFAPGLKDLDDAVEIRRRVLLAFEAAEIEDDPQRRKDLLTFAVVGGGPTGVELAGAIAELARYVMARDFRTINPQQAEIILLEGGPRILPSFSPDLSESAQRQLTQLGVKVRVNARVTRIDEKSVSLGDERIKVATVIWAAGVQATDFTRSLGVRLDRSGRVVVNPDLTLPDFARVFAIGDMVTFLQEGQPLPGVSPVAMQMGRCVARNIVNDLKDDPREKFWYVDKGNMATIGRKAAIAEIGKLHLRGFLAWLTWLGVHIFFLIGFRNRFTVLFNWAWSYFTYQRGARLITGRRLSLKPEGEGPEPVREYEETKVGS
ncbi:MAG TPA: NAD(P)/FAD-dependent oxidoreductase [Blastocatellia bacterium]|nr:NAD(P)/FAD-dependent oxidoreductase [Blastocatellia bacterium]